MILAIVIGYLIFVVALGIFLRRRVKGFEDFMVAGRSAGLFVVASSFVGSHFGGGMTVGGAELGATNGLSAVWYGLGAGFSYLLLLTIVRRIYALKQITIADVLESSYKSKRIRGMYALLSFAGSIGIIAGQILAGGAIFSSFGVSPEMGGAITFLIIVVYCALSGLYGVMVTDAIQVIIGGFGIMLAAVLAVDKIGGIEKLAVLPEQQLSFFPPDLATLIWLVVPTTLLGLISQPAYQRVHSSKDEKTAFRAPLIGAFVVMALAIFPVLIGMCARILWPDIEASQAVPMLLQEVFPPVVAAIFIAAILAAVMSTADSVLLGATANIVRDFYQQILRPAAGDKELLRVSTIATIVIGLGALSITYLIPRIIDLFVISYSIQVCGGLIPLVGALFWKGGTEQGAWASFVVGIGYITLSSLGVIDLPYHYIVGLIPALTVYVAVSFMTRKQPNDLTI